MVWRPKQRTVALFQMTITRLLMVVGPNMNGQHMRAMMLFGSWLHEQTMRTSIKSFIQQLPEIPHWTCAHGSFQLFICSLHHLALRCPQASMAIILSGIRPSLGASSFTYTMTPTEMARNSANLEGWMRSHFGWRP